jgi:hypothetical protein
MKTALAAAILATSTMAVAENVTVCGSSFTVTMIPQSPLVCLSVSGTPPTPSDILPLVF